MKTTNVIIIAIIAAVAAGFGGYKFRDYQLQKQRENFGGGQFFRQVGTGPNGPNGQNRNGTRFAGGGTVFGEIINIDDKSITVKMQDGSTKIVVLADSTTYSKSAEGNKSDLKQGDQIGVFGTANSDGSVTAQNVQLNPKIRRFGEQSNITPSSSK